MNNNGVGKFEKVSFEQFSKDYASEFGTYFKKDLLNLYKNIKLPKRATVGSAGYDFFSPISFYLSPNETIKIPTGIKCSLENGYVLTLYPRDSLGFNYRLRLENTVGIINSDNDGHIFIKITNLGNKQLEINRGEAFAQGIIIQFFLTYDDEFSEIRDGGIGSTNKN